MNTTFAFSIDFGQTTHAQAFAQICALAQQAGITFAPVGSVCTTEVTPSVNKVDKKTYADATDVECKWVATKTLVSYTLADGKYVGQTAVRKTLNKRLKDAGAVYDTEHRGWKFASTKKANDFMANTSALVSASEIEDVRAKAQARAEKKANKGV